MIKTTKHSYKGMNQDLSKSKLPNQYYFEGKNIRIVATNTQSTGSITNEKGNELIVTVPIPVINSASSTIDYALESLPYTTAEIADEYLVSGVYRTSGTQIIVGSTTIRGNIILLTTDNNGFDCIWRINDSSYDLELLYMRNMGFSISNPIQIINNFENEKIDKIYWVDGKNQLRFININHSILNQDLEELIDVTVNSINMVGSFKLSQPQIIKILQGGIHTAGMIQYAYNLYRINGSQTKISPVSQLVSLDKESQGGGDLNEIVSNTPVVRIDDIDLNYTHIKVYAIKYTSFNELPTISLIAEKELQGNDSLEIYDDGNIIETVSLEEFTFLGSDLIIPKHINSKDNRLFLANYKEVNFELDLDLRAYSFNPSSVSIIYDNLFLATPTTVSGTPFIVDPTDFTTVPEKFDSVNLDYNQYKYQVDGTTLGGEGKYIKYALTSETTKKEDSRFFKDEELYRLGIQFYNKYGGISLPKWIADFRAPNGNLKGLYNTLRVELTSEFYIWLNTNVFTNDYDTPIGYRILVAERTFNDKTIVANGLLTPMMVNDKSGTKSDDESYKRYQGQILPKLPCFFTRNVDSLGIPDNTSTMPIRNASHMMRMDLNKSYGTEVISNGGSSSSGAFYQFNSMLQMYSPEILFGEQFSLTNGLNLKFKGALRNTHNSSWSKQIGLVDGNATSECIVTEGISPYYGAAYSPIGGNPADMFDTGLVSHPGGSNANSMQKMQFYRVYGDKTATAAVVNNQQIIPINSQYSPTVTNISVQNTNKVTRIILNPSNNGVGSNLSYTGEITYTITPAVGYTTVNYSVYIKDSLTGGDYIALTNVTGTQVITYSYTHIVSITSVDNTYQLDYYLAIDPDANFNFDVKSDVIYHEDETVTPFSQTLIDSTTSTPNTTALTVTAGTANPGFIVDPVTPVTVGLYGTPEIIERGGSYSTYNNDPNYRYTNSLQSILTDGELKYSDDGNCGRRIVTMNSYGQRAITLVTGDDNSSTEHWNRPSLENLIYNSNITGDNYGVIGELVKSDVEVYLGNIYGGNGYEDKKRSNYLEIGDYKNISTPIVDIKSPGDTFVGNFRFERITTIDVTNDDQCAQQMIEILEFTTETVVDLKNRNDKSLLDWAAIFQPSNDSYHKYNRVYSQQSNLITRRDLNFNFKKVNFYDTNIIATKLKSSGELIDSWTDLQPNELITLDGKHGAINSLVSFRDELYTLQDQGVAALSINPRIQVQGNDGVALELGKGTVLNDYNYLSTESGTLNKWSVAASPTGIYYYDTLNKSMNLIKQGVGGLSDVKGMHVKFQNNDTSILKVDNPILKQGVVSAFDYINNDLFMTFHQNDLSFTISFNEGVGSFVSFYDYIPSRYISKGDNFITTEPNNTMLYKQYAGEYNMFYGEYHPSYVTLMVNPEADLDCVFNNIEYKSELYINDIDQPASTLTHVQLWNEYQDSGFIPLVLHENLSRKFRDWRISLPRQANSRDRIRNPWVFLKLHLDNVDNKKLILHDILVHYTI